MLHVTLQPRANPKAAPRVPPTVNQDQDEAQLPLPLSSPAFSSRDSRKEVNHANNPSRHKASDFSFNFKCKIQTDK
eukprot:1142999-Pelagomonas_calceolata.AAC.1